MDASRYPVSLSGELDAKLSRGLWLVKWALAIPHYIILGFLWLAVLVLTVVAFFAILVTGRYPRGIFDFNLGVFRWTWRVAFYSYGALGTDRYPPFTLADADYPARLEIAYPESLSRGLVLVKWWLLAIPHYIVVGLFLGGGSYAASRVDDWVWSVGFETGLIGILVLVAGFALLFTTRYPQGLFDFVLGLDRWVARVGAYVFLMRDEYPPFRLDQGGLEEPLATAGSPEPAAATDTSAGHAGGGSTAGRIVLVVVGVVAGIIAFGLLAGGCALVAVDQTQRDEDGFLMSPSREFSSPTFAIVSESADIDTGGAEWALDSFLGTVRIRSQSDPFVFVCIGQAAEVDRYLEGVEHDVVKDLDSAGDPEYERRSGGRPSGMPDGEVCVASAQPTGGGDLALDWEPEDGDWRVLLMNEDASRGVSSELSIGAQLDSVVWIGIGLLAFGALFAAAAALAITAGVRRRG